MNTMENFEYKMELRLQRAIIAWLILPWEKHGENKFIVIITEIYRNIAQILPTCEQGELIA